MDRASDESWSFALVDPTPAVPVQSSAAASAGDADRLPTQRRLTHLAAAILFALALLLLALGRGLLLRTLLPVALVLGAWQLTFRKRRPRPPPPTDTLTLDSECIAVHRIQGRARSGSTSASTTAFPLLEPPGLTLLSSRARDRLTAVLSAGGHFFQVGARVQLGQRRAFADRLVALTTVAGDDPALDALDHEGQPVELTPTDFFRFVDAVSSRYPGCERSLSLTDATGSPVLLSDRQLVAGNFIFDLRRPLEWRSIFFEERLGGAILVYQGTIVRQGLAEVVFVSLVPSTGPSLRGGESSGVIALDRAALRDFRLTQGQAVSPPSGLRIALDRPFMIPLRAALNEAPRRTSQPAPPDAPANELQS